MLNMQLLIAYDHKVLLKLFLEVVWFYLHGKMIPSCDHSDYRVSDIQCSVPAVH